MKITLLIFKYISAHIHEKLVDYKLYRKFKGGKWYYIVELDTGEEFWSRYPIPIQYGLTLETENYD